LLNQTQVMERLMREIEEKPDDPGLRVKLGRAAEQSGAFRLAGRCYEAALALDPANTEAEASLKTLAAKGTAGSAR
jgi:cytochrome c-type biogenesis protein CcmH/NrfG